MVKIKEGLIIKIIKCILIIFVLSFVFSLTEIKAAVYQSYVEFYLPARRGVANAGTLVKNDNLDHVVGVLSTKDTRDILFRFKGLTSNDEMPASSCLGTSAYFLIEVDTNSNNSQYSTIAHINTETDTTMFGMCTGTVKGEAKTRNTYLNKTYFNGTWFSSETVFNNLYQY